MGGVFCIRILSPTYTLYRVRSWIYPCECIDASVCPELDLINGLYEFHYIGKEYEVGHGYDMVKKSKMATFWPCDSAEVMLYPTFVSSICFVIFVIGVVNFLFQMLSPLKFMDRLTSNFT